MTRQQANDEGFALFIAMGAIILVSVVAVAGFWLSQDTLRESRRVQSENRAFQVASTGIDREVQRFTTSRLINGVYAISGSTPDGTYQITAQATGNPYEYRMTSVSNSGGTTETVTQRFFFLSLWDMNVGAGPAQVFGGGSGWNGNATVSGPLYVRGDMTWSSAATFEGGPLLIRDGGLIATGSGTFGLVRPIYLYSTEGLSGNKAATNVYLADNTVHNSVPDIDLPWVEAQYMNRAYGLAKQESCDNIMGSVLRTVTNSEAESEGSPSYPAAATKATGASSYYKYLGPSAGPSALGAGSTALTIGSTQFGRYPGNGYDSSSGKHDDFAYDPSTGTLYLEGTVFVDGPVTITPGVRRYVGNGTLVANGDVLIQTGTGTGHGHLAPIDSITGEPTNPSPDNCLGLVTPGDVTLGSSSIDGYMIGAVFCNGTFSMYGTGTLFSGSVLAGQIYGDRPNVQLHQNAAISRCLPESMPGAGGGVVFAGTWSRS